MWNQNPAGTAAPQKPAEESISSVIPRCLELGTKCADLSQHIAASLGLVEPQPPSSTTQAGPANLLQALRTLENQMQFAMMRLDAINQHLNG